MENKEKNSIKTVNGKLPLTKNPYARYIFLGLLLCLLPLLAELGFIKSSNLTIVGGVVIYAIVSLGLNLLLGFSGLISLGTAGFMGLGAYVSGYLTSQLDFPFLVAVLVAVLVGIVISILVGFVSLRVSGLYLAIATLCVAEILRKTFEEFDMFTGGFSGLSARFPTLFTFDLNRETTFVLLSTVLVLMMILTHNIVNGQVGRALHAMRGSEVAAQAMGVNLLKYRLIIFALAATYAVIGGALYIHFIQFSYPSVWILTMSLNILAVVVIGGLRSIVGTVLGAFVVFAIPDLVLKQLPIIGEMNGIAYIFNGVLIIIIIMFYPQGVINIFTDIKKFVVSKKGKGEQTNG